MLRAWWSLSFWVVGGVAVDIIVAIKDNGTTVVLH